MKTISCIIPAYNEESGISNVLSVVSTLIGKDLLEVIVVNDCSSDSTESLVKKYSEVVLINHLKNEGKSKSVADGIRQAKGDYIFLLDADLKYLTKQNIVNLISPVKEDISDISFSYLKNSWPLFPFKSVDYLTGERVILKEHLLPLLEKMSLLPSYGLEVFINKMIIDKHLSLSVVQWLNVENVFSQNKLGLLSGIRNILKIWWNVISIVGITGMYIQNIKLIRLMVNNENINIKNLKISFVIPAYNEEKILSTCLESLEKEIARYKYTTEVVVVNNASTDGTRKVAQSFKNVKVVDENKKGLVFARKCGMENSTGELIANIDADVIIPEGWLKIVMEEFNSNNKLAALSGPYIYYDLSRLQKLLIRIFYYFGYLSYIINSKILRISGMLQGGNYIVTRSALHKIGGYDTSISFYGEDTDIAKRIFKVGDVKWTFKLPMYTSGRRLREEGLLTMGLKYTVNYVWPIFFGRPYTKEYKDIRV